MAETVKYAYEVLVDVQCVGEVIHQRNIKRPRVFLFKTLEEAQIFVAQAREPQHLKAGDATWRYIYRNVGEPLPL